MWGWRSARAKSKAWEAARANALRAAEKHSWPPVAFPETAPPPRPPYAPGPPAAGITMPTVSPPPAPPSPRRMQFDGPSTPTSAPLYGRWVDSPADPPTDPAPAETAMEAAAEIELEPTATSAIIAAIAVDEPEPAELEPVAAEILVEETAEEPADAAVTTLRLVPAAEGQSSAPGIGTQPESQAEFLRLLEVVTSMCDHVIEYIEADRAERRMMIETLGQLSRTITDGSRPVIAAASSPRTAPTELFEARERLVGGSMAAGPAPDIDLRGPEARPEPQLQPVLTDASSLAGPTSTEIAVEVRGRFGDRWVDGFEICEVMSTPDGPRYRLRRQRDGVVLPELFDATSIRHIETFEQLNGEQLNGPPGSWSRS